MRDVVSLRVFTTGTVAPGPSFGLRGGRTLEICNIGFNIGSHEELGLEFSGQSSTCPIHMSCGWRSRSQAQPPGGLHLVGSGSGSWQSESLIISCPQDLITFSLITPPGKRPKS